MKPLYDFSCWVIKYNGVKVYGKIYTKGFLKNKNGQVIPLLWNHSLDDPRAVLGYAILESREEGVYAYCTLYDTSNKKEAIALIKNQGCVSISPRVGRIKYDNNYIVSGVIQEVSLVPARIDEDVDYWPVWKEN